MGSGSSSRRAGAARRARSGLATPPPTTQQATRMPFGCSSRAMAWAKPHGNLAMAKSADWASPSTLAEAAVKENRAPCPLAVACLWPPLRHQIAHRRPTPRSTLHLERVAIEQGTAAVAGAGPGLARGGLERLWSSARMRLGVHRQQPVAVNLGIDQIGRASCRERV